MDSPHTESHPWGFFLPETARILMLGSFPPSPKRWSMNFYYPNFINDMWRIMGLIYHEDKDYFILPGKKAFDEEKIRSFCVLQGLALGDTALEVIRLRDNAADQYLQVIKTWNPRETLSLIPHCETIVVTGQKSLDTILSTLPATAPKVGEYTSFSYLNRNFRLYRMPSSSRAYPKSLEEKALFYAKVFHKE